MLKLGLHHETKTGQPQLAKDRHHVAHRDANGYVLEYASLTCLYAVPIKLRQIAHMAPCLRAHGSVVLEESWNFMMEFGEDRDCLHHLKETNQESNDANDPYYTQTS